MLCARCACSRMTKNAVKRLCMFTGERLAFGQTPGGCAGWLEGTWDEAQEKPGGGTPGRNKKRTEENSMTHFGELFKPLPVSRPLLLGWESTEKAEAVDGFHAGIRARGGKSAGFGREDHNG